MRKRIALLLSVIMCISMWVGNIEFVKASQTTLNKSTWTETTKIDGTKVWKKIVDISGWDFDNMETGIYIPSERENDEGKFWDIKTPATISNFEIVDLESNNKGLKLIMPTKSAKNLGSKIKLDKNFDYELNYKIRSKSTGNVILQLVKTDDVEFSKNVESEIEYSELNGISGTLILNKTNFKDEQFAKLKIFMSSAVSEIVIDSLELVQISETNLNNTVENNKDSDNITDTNKSANLINTEVDTIPVINNSIPATFSTKTTSGLNKDTWTKVTESDGTEVWKKIIDIPNWEFENLSIGTSLTTDNTTREAGKFWTGGPGIINSMEVVDLGSGNKGLKIDATGTASANNLYSKISISGNYRLELNIKAIASGGSISFQKEPGTNLSPASGSFNMNSGAGTLKLSKESIDSANSSNGTKYVILRIWSGKPISEYTLDSLEFVEVRDDNPYDTSLQGKEQLFGSNDIITPTNAGNFENWGTETIPSTQTSGKDFFGEGVEIISGGYRGNNSAKIDNGKTLTLKIDNELNPNTEYSIYFAAKTDNKLSFKLSGFKNKLKFDYTNQYDNGNIYNWLENTKIQNKDWKAYRYDFTTGNDNKSSAQAQFISNGISYVDCIFIAPRNALDEIHYTLPSNSELSNGHRKLIDDGLQFMSWVPTDKAIEKSTWMKGPSLEKVKDMGLTAVQYNDAPNFSKAYHQQDPNLKWATAWGPKASHISNQYQDSSDGKTGLPTEEEWANINGHLTEDNGLGYEQNLISMCIGDEDDYSDTLIQNVKSWFELIREKQVYKGDGTIDNNIILHHNEVGNGPFESNTPNIGAISTFNESMLRKYVRTAKPDLITYDMYYFRERRIEQTVGGTVMGLYDDLNRYRIVSREGYDGTGAQSIPFGHYTYSWRTGPGAATDFKRGDGWYEMTESQINLYSFAPWAFGAKWLSNFRWLDSNPSYLFSDYITNPDGTINNDYHIYDQFKEMVRQSKNLGSHLTRIVNNGVAVIPGKHISNGNIGENSIPATNVRWGKTLNIDESKGNYSGEANLNSKVFISDIQVENLGDQNNGLNGDVFISYFDPLNGLTEDDKKVFTSDDPRYFMILNGLTSGDGLPAELQQGSAFETRQKITVQFELADSSYANKLKKVSRVSENSTGAVVSVPLTNKGGNIYEMTTTIGGGFADLYYWELGNPNTNTTTISGVSENTELIEGQQKYINNINKTDLSGRTITIGNIVNYDSIMPKPNMAVNINTPAAADLVDGKEIVLNEYATPGGNIGAIGMRYFPIDLWEFRTQAIEKNNNVKLEFKEYDWTKEQLIEKIKNNDTDLPDILTVPQDWLWALDGLIANDSIIAMNELTKDGQPIMDFTARKWNDAYTQMSTKDGKTYGAFTDPSFNPVGMFSNKAVINSILPVTMSVADKVYYKQATYSSVSNFASIYDLHKQDKWTFNELKTIINSAIGKNIKLFPDNEYFIRQLLISSGVTDPYNFDANSTAYQEAIGIYKTLKDNNLLMESTSNTYEGALNEYMQAFKDGNLAFIVAPYTDVAKHLSQEYWYYEDNAVRKTAPVKNWGIQTHTSTNESMPDGKVKWTVTVKQRQAGNYAMPNTDWNFLLFPKPTETDTYKAILSNTAIPVIIKNSENATNPNNIGIIWDKLAEEYKGLDITARFFKRGGIDYPDGRFWEPKSGSNTERDVDAIRKAALRDGYGDLFKATGVWDNVLETAIKDNIDFNTINQRVKEYLGIATTETVKLKSLNLTDTILSPEFKEDIYTYTAQTSLSDIKLSAEANEVDTKIEVLVDNVSITPNQSNQINDLQINLLNNETKITIKLTPVTGSNKGSQTYTITVTKGQSSTNADLISIDLTNVDLTPIFDKNILNYTGQAPSSISTLVAKSDKTDSSIEIIVNGNSVTKSQGEVSSNIVFDNTSNQIEIKVTAIDNQIKTYTLTISKVDTGLNPNWHIIHPDNSGWTIPDKNVDKLELKALSGNLTGTVNTAKNIFITEQNLIDRNNFEITVKMTGESIIADEEAGLIIYNGDDDYIVLGKKYNQTGFLLNYELNGVLTKYQSNVSDYVYDDTDLENVELQVPKQINPAYLKLTKNNNSISGYYSDNNVDWNFINTIDVSLGNDFEVGVFAYGGTGSTIFNFESFKVNNTNVPFVGGIDPNTIISLEEIKVETEVGKLPQLPSQIIANLYNGTTSNVNVIWDTINADMVSKFGEFTVYGTVENTSLKAKAIITVIDSTTPNPIISIEDTKVTTKINIMPQLPQQVNVTFKDGTIKKLNVIWDTITADMISKTGTFNIEGTVENTSLKAKAIITVTDEIPPTVNKDELINLISNAKQKLNGNYTEESKQNLIQAISNAEKVVSDINATSNDVSSAYEKLSNAIHNLVIIGDKIYITSLDNVKVETKIGTIPSLPNQITAHYNDNSTSKVIVYWDSITSDMVSKVGNFTIYGTVDGTNLRAEAIITVFDVNKTNLIDLINTAKNKLTGNYTNASKNSLKEIIQIAERVISSDNITQTDIDNVYNQLLNAINNLILVNSSSSTSSNQSNSNQSDTNSSSTDSKTTDTDTSNTTNIVTRIINNQNTNSRSETIVSITGNIKDNILEVNLSNSVINELIKECKNITNIATNQDKQNNLTGTKSVIEINITSDNLNKVEKLNVKISKSDLQNILNETNADIKISSFIGEMIFNQKAIQTIVSSSTTNSVIIGGQILNIQSLPTQLQQKISSQLGDRPIYEFTVSSDKKNITTFGDGEVIVRIPYEIINGESINSTIAYYIDDNGKFETVKLSNYNSKDKRFVFKRNHFSKYAIGYKQIDFNDIKGHWATDYIQFAVSRELFTGTTKTTFSPDTPVTRGMFVTLIGKLQGANTNLVGGKTFDDVDNNMYYAPYIRWATANNIVSGISVTKFAPEKPISREEMATMIYNANISNIKSNSNKLNTNKFNDENSISEWAKEAANIMYQNGILTGKGNNLFEPKQTATRAEAATIFQKLIDYQLN